MYVLGSIFLIPQEEKAFGKMLNLSIFLSFPKLIKRDELNMVLHFHLVAWLVPAMERIAIR